MKLHICSLLALSTLYAWSADVSGGECSASFQLSADHCAHKVFQDSPGWDTASICDITLQNYAGNKKCQNSTTCGRNFGVAVFDQQLFSITMKNIFISMLTTCCKDCALCSVREIGDTMHVNKTILESSDIIFPVLGNSNVQRMHGFYFLPSYQVPTSYYFTLKKPSSFIVGEVVVACCNMWPFLLICLLFALISGFLVWVIENRLNGDEFPRRFYAGIFDGFWWSFISMTTVGYGDKVTKSFLGKLYAVFWILIGITMCSMFTATLTSEIINARIPANTDLAGKDVAVMKGCAHDIQIVSEKGGIIHMGTIGNTMRGIDEMVNMLENGTVNGFVVDRNTYYHFSNRVKEPKYEYIGDKVGRMDMVRTEKKQSQETLACGMLIKKLDDYNYFKSYFDNNRLNIQSCNFMRMNKRYMEENKPSSMFSSDSEIFETVLIWSTVVLGAMLLIGLAVEGKRYYVEVKMEEKLDN